MKKFFKRQGKKLTAVATAFALLCTAGVIPEDVLQVSAAETETGGMEEQVPEEELVIDENFPDENFGNYLRKEADTDENGALSKEEVQSFREVRLNGQENDTPDNEKIESLKGIEKLTALTRVDVSYNKLSGELDLSNWSKLDSFSCMGNEITSLNLKTQTELKYLACADNLIETLDLSGQTGLTQLTCGDTLLKTIDLSGQTGSVYFACPRNCLTSILFPKAQNQEEEIAYQRSMNYLQQKRIDFKDEKIFPNFDTGRLRGIYVTGAGEEEDKSKDCLDTVKENDYVLTDLQAGGKVCYTYNCAAEGAKSEILLDFAITIGYPEGTMPPRYPNTQKAYDVPFTTQYLKEVPLPEDWKWSDEYDGNEELNDGNSSFYWAEYTGSDKEYYEECYQTASVGFYRDRCDHPQGMMKLYKVTDSTITENTTYAKCEAEECGGYFLAPKENSEYSSMEETDIPVVPVVDCTESTEIHVSYGTELKDLDLVHLKKAGYLSGQESPVSVNKLLVQNVWYKKDEDSKQEDYYGRVDFTTSLDGVVELTGEEKSLGSISCDRILEPGEYTLDLVMKVGEQNVHVLRTIFVDKIDLSKYSDYNLKITVNDKELSDEPISCNYTKEAVRPTVGIVDVKNNYSLIWNYDFIYDYINNVEVAEADQDNAPTIIVRGISDHYTGELRIPFTIKKRKHPDMPNSTLYASYISKAVGEVELSGGWEWASGDREKALAVGEFVQATAEYTGNDKDLYETIVREVTIIRKECDHGWDWELRNEVTESTCENGYSGDYFCKACGELMEEGETIYAPHELEFVEGKPATDTTSGNYPYYVCHKCGKYFEDADAEWETTLEKVTIPVRATSAPSVTPIPTQTVEETETPGQTPDPVQETATVAPTIVPSGNPSVSTAPVADPTKEPSASTAPVADPTKEPLVTVAPTGIPGQIPATKVPTGKPSETPVAEPTDAPDPLPSDTATPGQSMTPVPEISQAPAAAVPLPSAAPKQTPSASPAGQSKKPARVGKIIKDSQGNRYKVTSSNRRKPTVKFYSPGAKVKKVVISECVRIDGINYYVTALRSRAFEGNRKVTSVRLGGKVNTIGDRAFRNCRKLRDLYIQCTKLKPDNIGNRVFDGVCSGVRVSVPRSKLEEYRKMLQDKGLKKTVPVTYGKIK